MTDPDVPVNLDVVAADIAFPEIPAWTVQDSYSKAVATLEIRDVEDADLTVTLDSPDTGVHVELTVPVDFDDLVRLLRQHLEPMLGWIQRNEAEKEFQDALDLERDELQLEHERRRRARAAWTVVSTPHAVGMRTRHSLHRNSCAVITRMRSKNAQYHERGRREQAVGGGTHDGEHMLELLREVEPYLRELIGPKMVAEKEARTRRQQDGRQRNTSTDWSPLKVCRACSPLGERSAQLGGQIERLVQTRRLCAEQEQQLAALMDSLRHAVWEVEQEHLAALDGRDTSR